MVFSWIERDPRQTKPGVFTVRWGSICTGGRRVAVLKAALPNLALLKGDSWTASQALYKCLTLAMKDFAPHFQETFQISFIAC